MASVFRFANGIGVRIENPVELIRASNIATFKPRERTLSPDEIGVLFKYLEQVGSIPTIKLAVKFILLTMVRKSELLHATWDEISFENTLQPLLTVDALTTIVRSALQNESVAATVIESDIEQITSLHLYFRPVYAFEYVWSPADKTGVIEVDGLTGEIIENGNWFRDTFDQAFTRENLIELSSELASSIVPGSGTAIKVASKMVGEHHHAQK